GTFMIKTMLIMEKLIKPATIIVAIIAFVSLIFAVFKTNSVRDLDKIVTSGRIRVLTDNSSLGFKLEKDSVYGFQYEIVKVFADKLGVELEISENDDVAQSVEDLMKGKYDLLASMIPFTVEYKEQLLFSDPLQVNKQVLVQRNDSSKLIVKQYDLANDTIYLPVNSPYKMLISNLSNDIADTIYVSELKNSTTEVAVKMVADGIIKYTICSERLAKKMQLVYPTLNFSLAIGFQQEGAWTMNKKATELQKKLNEFLAEYVGSAAYWKLYRKYY
ncbi:MAG: transporter substrate-binding domain-containing protein, partial [Paludibacter sp.]